MELDESALITEQLERFKPLLSTNEYDELARVVFEPSQTIYKAKPAQK